MIRIPFKTNNRTYTMLCIVRNGYQPVFDFKFINPNKHRCPQDRTVKTTIGDIISMSLTFKYVICITQYYSTTQFIGAFQIADIRFLL